MRPTCLKPSLSNGSLRCVGSTTYKEYRNHFEKDRALVRRFQKIDVSEPNIEETIEILQRSCAPYYEEHHNVEYTDDSALKLQLNLSSRNILGIVSLPDKAIDIIDEVGAAQMLVPEDKRKKLIGSLKILKRLLPCYCPHSLQQH